MKVLWLAGHHFDPPSMGLFTYSLGLATALTGAGADVTYFGHRRTESEPPADPAWFLLGETHRRTVRGQLSRRPFMVAEIWDRPARRAFDAVLERSRPDVVVVDHLRSAGALAHISGVVPFAYVAHNHETSVKDAAVAAAGTPLHALAYRLDREKIRRLEQAVCDEAALVTAISPVDAASLERANGVAPENLLVLPPPYTGRVLADRAITDETPRRVVLVGNLEWAAKQRNLSDLLDSIADPLARHGIDLTIVAGDNSAREEFARRYPSVTFLGYVDDLAPVFADSRLALMFDPEGGGLKVKVLDYVFHRVPVVGLPDAMAGIPLAPGDDYLAARTPDEVVSTIVDTIDRPADLDRLHRRAAVACARHFDPVAIGRSFYDALARIAR